VTEQPVVVPSAPPLVTVAGVELMHTGTWNLSTGPTTFTTDDLRAAVAAMDCPAVRRPILKLGHTTNPAPGQPAVGFVANMAVTDDGRTLVGDYVGLPAWLGAADPETGLSVLSAAYPDRSVEGHYAYRCQVGHIHPFVVTAVALLGQEEPGIGTLQSLQDLADLYGVAAAGPVDSARVVVIPVYASRSTMPNPLRVAAQVTTEDVRRAFYASPLGADWSTWIEEMQLDPPQLIVVNDETDTRFRVPLVIGDGDGDAAVSFGDPVRVVVRYEDSPQPVAAGRVRFASRDESRPKPPAKPVPTPRDVHAGGLPHPKTPASDQAAAAPPKKGTPMDPTKIREALGLGPDASDDELREAIVAAGFAAPPAPPAEEPVAAARNVDGTMVIDASAWDAAQERIKRLEAADGRRRVAERDQVIASAISDGKFPPARRDHWVRLWDADPEGTRAVLASLAKNVIPVAPAGYPGSDEDIDVDAEFAHLFPPANSAKEA
jgi:hypothetical protein